MFHLVKQLNGICCGEVEPVGWSTVLSSDELRSIMNFSSQVRQVYAIVLTPLLADCDYNQDKSFFVFVKV